MSAAGRDGCRGGVRRKLEQPEVTSSARMGEITGLVLTDRVVAWQVTRNYRAAIRNDAGDTSSRVTSRRLRSIDAIQTQCARGDGSRTRLAFHV